MKEFVEMLEGDAVTLVNSTNTAEAVQSGSLPVFGTPMMIALMEKATRIASSPLLDEGETTVGTKISVTHDKASGVGTTVIAKAVLTTVEGRKMTFAVTATDDKGDIIGKGEIERFVVLKDKFMKKVNG